MRGRADIKKEVRAATRKVAVALESYIALCARLEGLYDELEQYITEYPAQYVVHWPSGAVDLCEVHARALGVVGGAMDLHTIAEAAEPGAECATCAYNGRRPVNEGQA